MLTIQHVRSKVLRNVGLRHKWEGFNLGQWLFHYIEIETEDELLDDEIVEALLNELGYDNAVALYKEWLGYDWDEDEYPRSSLVLFAMCELFEKELKVMN